MDAFLERLRTGPPLLLDGPTGTELERRGVDTSTPLWSSAAVRHRPDDVLAVHRAYAEAGAEVHTTVTFRADRLAFRRAGLGEAERRSTIRNAVRIAREGAAGGWVAGGVGPIGDCYAPEEVPPDDVLRREHALTASALVEAGVDLLLFETVNTGREACAAVEAASGLGVPVLVSFLVVRGARLLSGEPFAAALAQTVAAGADAVLVNCATLAATAEAVPVLRGAPLPWGAYPNGSAEAPRRGWTPGSDVGPADFAEEAADWLGAGASMIGGCCGTGPDHTLALRRLLDVRLRERPAPRAAGHE